MNDMLKIIGLNRYMQYGKRKLFLSDKEVLCVALDRTCTFRTDEDEIKLTNDQLEELVRQTTLL